MAATPRDYTQAGTDALQAAKPHREDSEDRRDKRQRLGISKISLRNFEMPVHKIYSVIFGKEARIDDITGELVHDAATVPILPPFGQG